MSLSKTGEKLETPVSLSNMKMGGLSTNSQSSSESVNERFTEFLQDLECLKKEAEDLRKRGDKLAERYVL